MCIEVSSSLLLAGPEVNQSLKVLHVTEHVVRVLQAALTLLLGLCGSFAV
jgi:hypothetical protein